MKYTEETITRTVRLANCPFCHYKWEPNVDDPKQCPQCKRYLDNPNPYTPRRPRRPGGPGCARLSFPK